MFHPSQNIFLEPHTHIFYCSVQQRMVTIYSILSIVRIISTKNGKNSIVLGTFPLLSNMKSSIVSNTFILFHTYFSIEEWLEKNFDCPCCRIEMITTDQVGQAISKLLTKDGRDEKKEVKVKPTMTEITPPPSPVSSHGGSPTRPQSP